MSVGIKFLNRITLNMLKEHTDFDLAYYDDFKIWVISKDYNAIDVVYDEYKKQFLQLYLPSDDKDSDECGTIEFDGDKCIYEFVSRFRGDLMLKELVLKFNYKFITDIEEEYLFYEDNVDFWDDIKCGEWYNVSAVEAMRGYGLCIDDNGNVISINGYDDIFE